MDFARLCVPLHAESSRYRCPVCDRRQPDEAGVRENTLPPFSDSFFVETVPSYTPHNNAPGRLRAVYSTFGCLSVSPEMHFLFYCASPLRLQARRCTVGCLTATVPQNPIGNAATLIKSSGLEPAIIEKCTLPVGAECVSGGAGLRTSLRVGGPWILNELARCPAGEIFRKMAVFPLICLFFPSFLWCFIWTG